MGEGGGMQVEQQDMLSGGKEWTHRGPAVGYGEPHFLGQWCVLGSGQQQTSEGPAMGEGGGIPMEKHYMLVCSQERTPGGPQVGHQQRMFMMSSFWNVYFPPQISRMVQGV